MLVEQRAVHGRVTKGIESPPLVDPPGEEKVTPASLVWDIIWVLARISIVLAVWLLLFVAVFLGFFTVPFLLLLSFTLAYVLYRLLLSLRRLIAPRLGRTHRE